MAHPQANSYSKACLWNVQQKSVAGGTEAREGSGLLSHGGEELGVYMYVVLCQHVMAH